MFGRREFVIGSGALAVASCATVPKPTPCTPFPTVNVDPARVIRTVAGLRPFRSTGFLVERQLLGDKALVHNYGHGGAGITLSWGSSRLAADLGLAGHSGPVAIVGSGVMGLTTARLVQEAGFPVTLYTAALPPDTTSAVAGGQVSPFGHYDSDAVSPAWVAQFQAAMAYSWARFQTLVGERYGIRWLPTYQETRRAVISSDWMDPYFPNARILESKDHPFPFTRTLVFDTMYVETPRFMAQLMSEVLSAGGAIRLRRFNSLADVATLSEKLIFNCTGVGARDLVGDTSLVPVRGQLAVLRPQREVRYAVTGDFGYMFPRNDGILLGGTFERGIVEAVPNPAAIAGILERHRQLFGGLRCAA